MRGKNLNITGLSYSTITVQGRGSKARYWKHTCSSCGSESEAPGYRLTQKAIICECQRNRVRHGHARRGKHSPTYGSWQSMHARVRREKNYEGIKIDPRWTHFDDFLADMHERPEGKTLDRCNPFGGYGPDNCRWAPLDVQAENKRGANLIRYSVSIEGRCGKHFTKAYGTASEWAWYLREVSGSTIWTTNYLRLVLRGMSIEDILSSVSSFHVPDAEIEAIRNSREFHHMWADYNSVVLEEAYLQAV